MKQHDRPGADRLYDWLLRAYPRAFRERFGAGMREAFAREHADMARRSTASRAAFWICTCFQALWFGTVERRAAHFRQGAPMRPSFTVDWRDAFRSLRATPVVTAVAVLSLALGIGANTALFSILNSLVFKTLPVRDPARLVIVDDGEWTNPIWEQIRDRRRQLFDNAFAWSATSFDLSTHGQTDNVQGVLASGDMFDVLGVQPILGRTFTEVDDARTGGPDGPVAVIGYDFWQRRFGGAPDVLGRQLTVNRLAVTIIGVAPPKFLGLDVGQAANIIVPLNDRALMAGGSEALDGRSNWWLEIMARLKPGQTIEQAQAALRGIQPQVRAATLPQGWPEKQLAQYLTEPLTLVSAATGESSLRGSYERPLKTILAIVAAVLLIACANIANLLLARAASRRREMSLRLALGASRLRLARQLLAESLLLAGGGALLGLAVAKWGSALLVRQLETTTTGVTLDLSMDWRVLAFTAGVALTTCVLFGLAPALGVSGVAPNEALKAAGRSTSGDRVLGLKSILVAGQVALSLTLVVGAVLFVDTLSALTSAPLGFQPEPLLVANVTAPAGVGPDQRLALFERLQERLAAVPGVSAAAYSVLTPMGNSRWNTRVEPIPGGPTLTGRQRVPWVNVVGPGWFTTFGMHLVAGRDIDRHDVRGSAPVLVVNEAFARRFFPNGTAIGQFISASIAGPDSDRFQIVGVVNDAVYTSVRAGFEPTMYVPFAQLESVDSSAVLVLRAASGRPETLTRGVGQAIAEVDHDMAFTIVPFGAQLRAGVRRERLVAILGAFFGGLALLLAGLGLYGVTAHSVTRRRTEIGIRMALGADASGVVRLVMARVGAVVATGIALGAALSWWASTLVASLLFGLGPRDPLAFAAAALALVAAAALACWPPAYRASRIDPVRVLREG